MGVKMLDEVMVEILAELKDRCEGNEPKTNWLYDHKDHKDL